MRAAFAFATLALAACSASTPPAIEEAPFFMRHSMQAEVNPAIVSIWDVGNNAMNETGGLDGAQMTDALWAQLESSAEKMAVEAERMAMAHNIQAATAGNMATGEYEVPMSDVQRFIDADPEGLRTLAQSFAALSRELEAAAKVRDADLAGDLVARMDRQCSVCHAQFWYAESP